MRNALAVLLLVLLPSAALAQVQTTIAQPSLPDLSSGDTAARTPVNGPDAIYCRPPQHRTDSQLMGPKVCMTNKEWNDLAANGFEIGPDGVKVSVKKNIDILSH
ncbi:MAG TPA: hypothetical protein VHZ32_14005 [Rhizomicrobium sp.]|nr:hypothetical protein [Rhizomicrobium sp.]